MVQCVQPCTRTFDTFTTILQDGCRDGSHLTCDMASNLLALSLPSHSTTPDLGVAKHVLRCCVTTHTGWGEGKALRAFRSLFLLRNNTGRYEAAETQRISPAETRGGAPLAKITARSDVSPQIVSEYALVRMHDEKPPSCIWYAHCQGESQEVLPIVAEACNCSNTLRNVCNWLNLNEIN